MGLVKIGIGCEIEQAFSHAKDLAFNRSSDSKSVATHLPLFAIPEGVLKKLHITSWFISSDLEEVLELGPPEVSLDDKLALLGEALHAADDKVQLVEGLHREVEVARVDLAREARVGELAAVVAEPPRQVAVRRQQFVQLELLQEKLEFSNPRTKKWHFGTSGIK